MSVRQPPSLSPSVFPSRSTRDCVLGGGVKWRPAKANFGLDWAGMVRRAKTLACASLSVVAVGCLETDGQPTVDAGGFDAGGSEVAGNGCGLAGEPEPNDTRETAATYVLGTPAVGCVASAADHDFHELGAPADPAGGFVSLRLGNVGEGSISARVYAASDSGQITHQYATTKGQTLSAFFAAAAGHRYRLDVADFTGWSAPYRYELMAAYTRADDAFEPNDTRAAAKSITLDAVVRASLFAGFVSGDAIPAAAYDDWYAVTLTAAPATVRLDDVPTNIAPDVHILDASGEVDRKYNATRGGSVVLATAATRAGMHLVRVGVFAGPPEVEGKGALLPDHFTRRYRLTVTQP